MRPHPRPTDGARKAAFGGGIRRPGFDALHKAIARREIDIVAAWSVDRLGRSLPDLVAFLNDLQGQGCDLYLHQQALDTSTPSGRMLFQMLAVFAEFERAIIRSRIVAGQARARAKGVKFGRPPLAPTHLDKVRQGLVEGCSIRAVARSTGVSTATVQRIKRSMRDGGEPGAGDPAVVAGRLEHQGYSQSARSFAHASRW